MHITARWLASIFNVTLFSSNYFAVFRGGWKCFTMELQLFLLVSQIQNLARLFQNFSNTHKLFPRNKPKTLSKDAWHNLFFNITKATKVQFMPTPESSEQAGGWFAKPYELFSTVKYSS